jgi:hypothetical protein
VGGGREFKCFCNLILEMIFHCFCHILFIRNKESGLGMVVYSCNPRLHGRNR